MRLLERTKDGETGPPETHGALDAKSFRPFPAKMAGTVSIRTWTCFWLHSIKIPILANGRPSRREHLKKVRKWHQADLARACGETPPPDALVRKYPNASSEWDRQYVFPADKVGINPDDGKVPRYHIYEKTFQSAIGRAVRRSELTPIVWTKVAKVKV